MVRFIDSDANTDHPMGVLCFFTSNLLIVTTRNRKFDHQLFGIIDGLCLVNKI